MYCKLTKYLICFFLFCSIFKIYTYAAEDVIIDISAEGSEVIATIQGDTCIISGEGSTANYGFDNNISPLQKYAAQITKVVVEDGVSAIGDYLFNEMYNMEYIDITDTVQYIGVGCFYKCSSLLSVRIPDGCTIISDSTFYRCANIKSVSIPDSITRIGHEAFFYCTDIVNLTIPEGVTDIGSDAFNRFGNESTVLILPESLDDVHNDTFATKDGVTIIAPTGSVLQNYIYANRYNSGFTNFNYFYIDDISIIDTDGIVIDLCNGGNSEQTKGTYAFGTLKDDGTLYVYGNGKVQGQSNMYSDHLIPYSDKIKKVIIQEGITGVIRTSFENFNNLEYASLPDSIKYVGDHLFNGCSKLQDVRLPDSMHNIPDGMFYRCSMLNDFTFPESCTSIGNKAFIGCTSLRHIVVPKKVTSIGTEAFCQTGLESLTINGNIGTIAEGVLSYCNNLKSVYITGNITKIEQSAFMFSGNLETVKLPNTVKEIDNKAFYNCEQLSNLKLPSSITYCNDLFEYVKGPIIVQRDSYMHKYMTGYGGREYKGKLIVLNDYEESEVPVHLTVSATQYDVSLPESIVFNFGSQDVKVISSLLVSNNMNVGSLYINNIRVISSENGWKIKSISDDGYWQRLPFNTKEFGLAYHENDLSAAPVLEKVKLNPNSTVELEFTGYIGGHSSDVAIQPVDVVLTIGT